MMKLAIALCPAILLAQSAASFDVATVKPSDALKNAGFASGWSIVESNDGLKITGNLQTFIKYAYSIDDVQISGGPPWLDRDFYEINGKAARQITVEERKQMLQSLLSDRFQLAVHRETRELPLYSMVLAKGGAKLQRGDAATRSSSSGATFLRGTMDSGAWAAALTSTLHRTVIDNTALQGIWKFDLTWAADDNTAGPSLFTALQEQPGLKMESTKGPVQVLVIDHAEKPSNN
ncbi:MAG TPA: TIGR03435 family protein [Bryobacteraceae bacterium]|jgi:uncharacterized protein (TIGR03435 family)